MVVEYTEACLGQLIIIFFSHLPAENTFFCLVIPENIIFYAALAYSRS